MIGKALLLFLALVILYCISIQVIMPSIQVSQHQWQTNSIKAQNFLYTADTCTNVVVGSSLSARLNVSELCNLSFVGLSAFDGLRMLESTNYKLSTIYIETNILFRDEDSDFTGQLTNPFLYYTKKYIPALRDGKQPLAIFAKTGYETFRHIKNGNKKIATSVTTVDPVLFDKLLANQINLYATVPTSEEMNRSMSKLQKFVEKFKKRGIRIVFFEMPVHEKLCDLPLSVQFRKSMRKAFPPAQYRYIPQPDCRAYHTTDGVHLTEQEAIRYVAYFREQGK